MYGMEWVLPIDGVDVVAEPNHICLECSDLVELGRQNNNKTKIMISRSVTDEKRTVLARPAVEAPPEPEASRLDCLVITLKEKTD